MAHWIFKLSDQEVYPDEIGVKYVYDNRHSIHVATRDSFLYLDKRGGRYSFNGHGDIVGVSSRKPTPQESVTPKVRRIYSAQLGEYVRYSSPLDIRSNSIQGKLNRSKLGIIDVNRLGWSGSIASIPQTRFEEILDLAYAESVVSLDLLELDDYEVPDTYSLVKRRHSLESFKAKVLGRQNHTCAICGTTMKEVLDVAHISSYAGDPKNRANPANGIGLCSYCHRAFDGTVFTVHEDGEVFAARDLGNDAIAKAHLSGLSSGGRVKLLAGIDKKLLRKRSGHSPIK